MAFISDFWKNMHRVARDGCLQMGCGYRYTTRFAWLDTNWMARRAFCCFWHSLTLLRYKTFVLSITQENDVDCIMWQMKLLTMIYFLRSDARENGASQDCRDLMGASCLGQYYILDFHYNWWRTTRQEMKTERYQCTSIRKKPSVGTLLFVFTLFGVC